MGLDILEYSAIEAWKRGRRKDLVRLWEQQKGKAPSSQLHQFVLDLLEGKKGKKGAPKKTLLRSDIMSDFRLASIITRMLESDGARDQNNGLIRHLRAVLDLNEQVPLRKSKNFIVDALAKKHGVTPTRIRQILSGK